MTMTMRKRGSKLLIELWKLDIHQRMSAVQYRQTRFYSKRYINKLYIPFFLFNRKYPYLLLYSMSNMRCAVQFSTIRCFLLRYGNDRDVNCITCKQNMFILFIFFFFLHTGSNVLFSSNTATTTSHMCALLLIIELNDNMNGIIQCNKEISNFGCCWIFPSSVTK